MARLLIQGLPNSTNEESLMDLFTRYGKVHTLKLKRDPFTGKMKGTALIEMEGNDARRAIAGLDGSDFHGSTIYVNRLIF